MMRHPGLVLLLPLAAGVLLAQSTNNAVPEIRGTVLEQGPNTFLSGVEVTLTEFVPVDNDLQPKTFGTALTDSQGAFSFKPNHIGDFRLNIKKAGYANLSVDADRGIYLGAC